MKYILLESNLKKIIKDKFNLDLTNKIKKITSTKQLPYPFSEIPPSIIKRYMKLGPMYLIKVGDDYYLCLKYNNENRWMIVDENDRELEESRFMDKLGVVGFMGLGMDDIIDLYYKKNEDLIGEASIFTKINNKLKDYFDDRSENEKLDEKISIETQKLVNLIVNLYYTKYRPKDKRIIKSLNSNTSRYKQYSGGDTIDNQIMVVCQIGINEDEFDYGSYHYTEAYDILKKEMKKIYDFAEMADIKYIEVDGKTYVLTFSIPS
jgi:hypothetical protein